MTYNLYRAIGLIAAVAAFPSAAENSTHSSRIAQLSMVPKSAIVNNPTQQHKISLDSTAREYHTFHYNIPEITDSLLRILHETGPSVDFRLNNYDLGMYSDITEMRNHIYRFNKGYNPIGRVATLKSKKPLDIPEHRKAGPKGKHVCNLTISGDNSFYSADHCLRHINLKDYVISHQGREFEILPTFCGNQGKDIAIGKIKGTFGPFAKLPITYPSNNAVIYWHYQSGIRDRNRPITAEKVTINKESITVSLEQQIQGYHLMSIKDIKDEEVKEFISDIGKHYGEALIRQVKSNNKKGTVSIPMVSIPRDLTKQRVMNGISNVSSSEAEKLLKIFVQNYFSAYNKARSIVTMSKPTVKIEMKGVTFYDSEMDTAKGKSGSGIFTANRISPSYTETVSFFNLETKMPIGSGRGGFIELEKRCQLLKN